MPSRSVAALSKALAGCRPYAGRDGRGIGTGIDQHAASGLLRRDLPERRAQPAVKLDVFRLEPVGSAFAATRCGALHPDFDGHVEDDGEIRLEVADGDALHRVEKPRRHLAERALIGAGRIRKAVAQHPDALRQSGLDHGMHVIVARRGEQQRFSFRAQQLAHPRQDDMPDDLGAGRPARLAGDEDAQLGRVEPVGQQLDLRRLAGPLPAFEGDEAPASGRPVVDGIGHGQSFSTPARKILTTSSPAPSMARRMVEPVATASAA